MSDQRNLSFTGLHIMLPAFLGMALLLFTGCQGASSASFVDKLNQHQGFNAALAAGSDDHLAPEFPDGMEWLNTSKPVRLADLRGKVVLLDFWTFCCINCMHIIPDLKTLEQEYPDELVVIGVHSAKFAKEKLTDNIKQAILRYEIKHPVVNDDDMAIWDTYGVHSWPTVILIDPMGNIVARQSGEGVKAVFEPKIAKVISEFDGSGVLNRKHINFKLETTKSRTGLLFPGKVLADEAIQRLYIADSNHNRIVIATLDGDVLDIAGSGEIGLTDGSFDDATFNHPQGMALYNGSLYVADTENHALRRLDLSNRSVETIAGNGRQGGQFNQGGDGAKVSLNSPWDLTVLDGYLYIAMAGSHQIWRMDFSSGVIKPWAGSGSEGLEDGGIKGASLAQPSGITTDGTSIFFADSETSSIRTVGDGNSPNVETIIGHGLFVFGDVDGTFRDARLQHPLGVAYSGGLLYVVDTYNNKIKVIDPSSSSSNTLYGSVDPGYRDGGSPLFDEPGGLSIAGGMVYIADTNNHAIRIAPLAGGPVSTLELKGLK